MIKDKEMMGGGGHGDLQWQRDKKSKRKKTLYIHTDIHKQIKMESNKNTKQTENRSKIQRNGSGKLKKKFNEL